MTKFPALRTLLAFPLLVGVLAFPFVATAAVKNKNPASKIYVADITGESHIDTGERIESLTKKSVYVAEGTSIETKPGSSQTLVFSNGTAIYVGPDSRFEVKKFLQEPFLPNRSDLDAEPSISQTIVKITRGSVGVCTSKLVAGSSMTYQTPHATVNIRGRKVMIEVSDTETRVSLIEGDVTVFVPDVGGTSQTLRPGQQAIIRKTATDQTATLAVQPIMDEQQAKLDENVSLACISRRTVFFEVAQRGEGEDAEIRPVEVVPANPDPGFTVSPARIGG
ncbi:hypothetical protein CMV30_00765 [Nibricoccus aquaticus]|uniref:FecR protein domain-containing protein n=1 Tax=Nibricoccus aquaticus TaxID=2576891 RepID=A0A290QBC8_9BACT|nr:FecR family protein [Nibricoccus aquaticus]ATC62618.1 hypothetical protein CMV30_00765 [Nibricoccus aquaticus]